MRRTTSRALLVVHAAALPFVAGCTNKQGETESPVYLTTNFGTVIPLQFNITPRNVLRKFRIPVHSPSSVLTWTSRTPSPSSSRAHSRSAWHTVDRDRPYAAGDASGCVGRWVSGRWHTPAAERYIAGVQSYQEQRVWEGRDFREL